MTEYDYSPSAMRAHLAKQAQVSKWASNTDKQHRTYGLPNPFAPSNTPRQSDFYAKPSTPSEVYGPDRPPSPPRSAPMGFGYGGGYGYGTAGGYTGGYTSPQGQSPAMQPTWNGYAWVYNLPQQAQPLRYDTGGQDHGHRSHRRHKSHHRDRRRSVSSPPPTYSYSYGKAPAPQITYAPQTQQHAQQIIISSSSSRRPKSQHRSSSFGSIPMYSAQVQALVSPPLYAVPPAVIVDGAKRKGSKLRKDRH
ncbi:hypothetical protein DFP72DRAFT_57000 [Ephemerocybe angulata]|uniref:Uncharacterized protein n=1 Tax=Ephemerocybe angulata TaxID=980116 RepID=A0A8H6I8N1_9AGAR|nr:hypothetical protein DFP72DRAFT_57000 [Tulosesus angulatus]